MLNSIRHFKKIIDNIAIALKHILEPSRLVALATFILAYFTYQYIGVSNEMVQETKRLATLSQQQFKIKSYPLLFTEVNPYTVTNNNTVQIIKIVNRGEITAFRLNTMIIHGYGELNNNLKLKILTQSSYELGKDKYKLTYLEENVIPPNDTHEIAYIQNSTEEYKIDALNYLIIIIKFKVPYDNEFRYQTKIYKKVSGSPEKPKSNDTWSWAKLHPKDNDEMKKIIFENKIFTQPTTKEFLSGYGELDNEVL